MIRIIVLILMLLIQTLFSKDSVEAVDSKSLVAGYDFNRREFDVRYYFLDNLYSCFKLFNTDSIYIHESALVNSYVNAYFKFNYEALDYAKYFRLGPEAGIEFSHKQIHRYYVNICTKALQYVNERLFVSISYPFISYNYYPRTRWEYGDIKSSNSTYSNYWDRHDIKHYIYIFPEKTSFEIELLFKIK